MTALGHISLPWIAFARTDRNVKLHPTFVAPPAWAVQYAEAGLTVLLPSFVGRSVTEFNLAELLQIETEMIDLCNPQTIGELLFNCWD